MQAVVAIFSSQSADRPRTTLAELSLWSKQWLEAVNRHKSSFALDLIRFVSAIACAELRPIPSERHRVGLHYSRFRPGSLNIVKEYQALIEPTSNQSRLFRVRIREVGLAPHRGDALGQRAKPTLLAMPHEPD